jgi:hypothetical protein
MRGVKRVGPRGSYTVRWDASSRIGESRAATVVLLLGAGDLLLAVARRRGALLERERPAL